MLTKPQYRALVSQAAQYTNKNGQSPLKRIALIGADYDAESENGLIEDDWRVLKTALNHLAKLGHPIAPDPKFEILNIHKHFGGQDFLKPRTNRTIDLAIICYIQRTQKAKEVKTHGLKYSGHEIKSQNPWLESAQRHGCKAIVTLGGKFRGHGQPRDVIAEDFLAPNSPYRHIGKAPCKKLKFPVSLVCWLRGYKPKLEFMIHKDLQ